MNHHDQPRRLVLAFLLLALVAARPLGLVGQAPTAADIVTKVRNQFVPDPRIGVFDVRPRRRTRRSS